MGKADPKLVGITPAMREGSGLVEFENNSLSVITTSALQNSMR
jgi:deoxyxylulose-5-phosphate synthase